MLADNASLSQTSRNLGSQFRYSYNDHPELTVNGTYYEDTVTIGSHTIQSMQIGVAESMSGIGYGVLGLGPQDLEFDSTKYPTFTLQLLQQKHIDHYSYGLWLSGRTGELYRSITKVVSDCFSRTMLMRSLSLDSTVGEITFGGYDGYLVAGNLTTGLPIVASADERPRVTIPWSYISVTSGNDSQALLTDLPGLNAPLVPNLPAVSLDTGSKLSFLPATIAGDPYIWNSLKTVFSLLPSLKYHDNGWYDCPCELVNHTGFLDFGFGTDPGSDQFALVRIPFTQLPVEIYSPNGPYAGNSTEDGFSGGRCLFAFQPMSGSASDSMATPAPGSNDVPVLGLSFLRSAYMYVDFNAKVVGLANCKINAA